MVAALASAAVVVTGAATLAGPGPEPARAEPAGAGLVGAGPDLQTIDLTPPTTARGSARTDSAGPGSAGTGSARTGSAGVGSAGSGSAGAAARTTQPYSMIGATWTDPEAELAGTVRVRARAIGTGVWTGWQTLEGDEPNAAEPGAAEGQLRGSTDPLWVGESDGVEAQVVGAAGETSKLPAGLRLDLINPSRQATTTPTAPTQSAGPEGVGTDSAPQARVHAAPAPLASAAVRPRPVPKMVTRAGWGANESIVEHAPEYTSDVQVVFVHHTAGSNGYSCSQSAGIVRGIELYHVRSKGWNDIGYNFLVDKCGTLFEGRKGGVNRPVLGAHTLGFNSHSAAIAVIGNYNSVAAPAGVRTVIAQVAAYKLGLSGATARGQATLVSSGSDRFPAGRRVTLNRISAHRDTGQTECPGDTLYRQIGSIRSVAASGPASFGLSRMGGTRRVGAAYYTRGAVAPYWSLRTPSSLMWCYDVRVDGRYLTSAPPAHRAVTLKLAPGRHTVTVTAVHLSGRSASFTRTVVADTVAPAFAAGPSLALGTGSLAASVPVRLGWKVSDPGGLASVGLTAPGPVSLGVTAQRFTGRVTPGRSTTFTLRATDRTGNARSASVTRTASITSEADAERAGSWQALRNPAFLGGSSLRSTARNASMTWTFSGRAVALAVSRTSSSGRVKVYVDGDYAGVLDLRSSATQNRQAVWTRYFGSSAGHTVRIVVEGSTGRPSVIMDGLVVLR